MKYWLGCFWMLALSAVSVQAQELHVTTEKPEYWRYELVKIIASQGQTTAAQASPVALPRVLKASVWSEDEKMTTAGSMQEIPLKKQANGTWEGYWPIPFNPELGEYTAKISLFLKDEARTITASADFEIKGREAYTLPKGFSVVTDEGGKYGPGKTPSVEPGGEASWKNLVKWADYMGADALFQCIGQTQVWGSLKADQFPWPDYYVRLTDRMGELAHANGLKYGAWITSFVVIGDHPEETGYQFTSGYDRKLNQLRPLRYVSLGCEQRIQHMIELLKKFEASPQVDFLGLDYMRTDFGGYEFADEFVHDMSIPTPPEWGKMSAAERGIWFARLIEIVRDESARDKWQWWRAHKIAMVISHIMEEVKPTKPVWVFSLGWKTGHQHGQDLYMMRDAGISFNSPMLYSIAKPDFPSMLQDWKNYLQQGAGSVVVGECVDWNLLGRTFSPAGPQEHLDRQKSAMRVLQPVAKSFGFFWHDLARAFFGARGPYGSLEWIVAGATSFTRLKAANKRYAYQVEMVTPKELVLKEETEIAVKVTNTSGNTLTAVSVELLPMARLIRLDESAKVLHNLAPQAGAKTAIFKVRVDQVYEKNGGWQMLAVRAKSAEDGAKNPWFDFVYLPITGWGLTQAPGNTRTAMAQTSAPQAVSPTSAPAPAQGAGKK